MRYATETDLFNSSLIHLSVAVTESYRETILKKDQDLKIAEDTISGLSADAERVCSC